MTTEPQSNNAGRGLATWTFIGALLIAAILTGTSFFLSKSPKSNPQPAVQATPTPKVERSALDLHRRGKPTSKECPLPLEKFDYAKCDCCFSRNSTAEDVQRITNDRKKMLMVERSSGIDGVRNCDLRMSVLRGRHPSHFCMHRRYGALRTDCIITEILSQIFFPELSPDQQPVDAEKSSDDLNSSPFFVETGALDGVDDSNTHFFQAKRGWGGLLVEGSTKYFPKAQKTRQQEPTLKVVKVTTPRSSQVLTTVMVPEVKVVHAAACGLSAVRKGRSLPFYDKGGKGLGGLVDSYSENFAKLHLGTSPKNLKRSSGKIHCVSLSDEVAAMNRTHVDFLSLDIEGAEYQALSAFNFTQVSVGVVAVELDGFNPVKDAKCRHLMEAAWGMTFFLRSGNDEIWFHPQHAPPKGPWAKCY